MLTAYITFNGTTEAAFNFYTNALGGQITNLQRMSDTPHGSHMPEAEQKKIMHISMTAPGGISLMGSDFFSFNGEVFTPGNNFSLSLHPGSEALADELFAKLSAGGAVTVAMSKAPWGDYFGMFTDQFGIKWMINCAAK